jgi:hypothetical protein
LASAGRKMTRCSKEAQRKGHWHKRQNDDVGKGTQKGQMDKKRRWKDPGCKNGIRNRDFKKPLHLRKQDLQKLQLESTGNVIQTYRKTTGLEIANQISGSYVASRKIKDWTLWRGRHPPKRKKNLLGALA